MLRFRQRIAPNVLGQRIIRIQKHFIDRQRLPPVDLHQDREEDPGGQNGNETRRKGIFQKGYRQRPQGQVLKNRRQSCLQEEKDDPREEGEVLIPDVIRHQGPCRAQEDIADQNIDPAACYDGKGTGKVNGHCQGQLAIHDRGQEEGNDDDWKEKVAYIGSQETEGKADGKNDRKLPVAGPVIGKLIPQAVMPQGKEENREKKNRNDKQAVGLVQQEFFSVGQEDQPRGKDSQ